MILKSSVETKFLIMIFKSLVETKFLIMIFKSSQWQQKVNKQSLIFIDDKKQKNIEENETKIKSESVNIKICFIKPMVQSI